MASNAAKVELGALTGERSPAQLTLAGASPPVLGLHGFGGTPFEVEGVIEAARRSGLAALCPLLPGHGKRSARALSVMRYSDWFSAAEQALLSLGEPAVIAGFSMGSLLAMELAIRYPERVLGLVLMGNAAWLKQPFPGLALSLAERLRLPDFMLRKRGPDIGDALARADHVSYNAHPVHAAIEVRRAGERLREELGKITCPTLVLHGAKDRVCPVENAWRVAERLGTEDCRVVVFPRSRHVLMRDFERAAVREEIARFLRRWAPAGAEAEPENPAAPQTPVEP
ncbi:MAG TPA: alpha/beta fold hydrolase [Polyangiaceae bacterium]|nr:alpha/beta fold hydrolase [Polyangiaceae bacterium]